MKQEACHINANSSENCKQSKPEGLGGNFLIFQLNFNLNNKKQKFLLKKKKIKKKPAKHDQVIKQYITSS